MPRPTRAFINIAALQSNLQRVKACASTQRVMAVIKANAYNHGAIRVANALESNVDAFAVCCLEEALELREAGITKPMVLLEGVFHPDELPVIVHKNFQIVIHSSKQLEYLVKVQLKKPINVWLKVDTGMHRLGFAPNEIEPIYKLLYKLLQQNEQVAPPIRLMSHLACADDRQDNTTEQQTQILMGLINSLNIEEGSLANSAGILGWPQTHLNWVRPGIMLYGASPFVGGVAEDEELQPVMQLQSVLISIKRHRKGEAIGYGATWRCPQVMPVGVVAIGYADGYPRHAPSGTPVLVNGRRVQLIGRVSMDMISVDLRTQPNAKIGDPVVLWGKNLPVEEIASFTGTIPYELLCNVGSRVEMY